MQGELEPDSESGRGGARRPLRVGLRWHLRSHGGQGWGQPSGSHWHWHWHWHCTSHGGGPFVWLTVAVACSQHGRVGAVAACRSVPSRTGAVTVTPPPLWRWYSSCGGHPSRGHAVVMISKSLARRWHWHALGDSASPPPGRLRDHWQFQQANEVGGAASMLTTCQCQ